MASVGMHFRNEIAGTAARKKFHPPAITMPLPNFFVLLFLPSVEEISPPRPITIIIITLLFSDINPRYSIFRFLFSFFNERSLSIRNKIEEEGGSNRGRLNRLLDQLIKFQWRNFKFRKSSLYPLPRYSSPCTRVVEQSDL